MLTVCCQCNINQAHDQRVSSSPSLPSASISSMAYAIVLAARWDFSHASLFDIVAAHVHSTLGGFYQTLESAIVR